MCEREMKKRHASTQTGSPPSQKQQEQHSNPHLLFLFILQSLFFLYPPPPSVSVLQAAKMLALPPPFVLQWERECTADALLSAAQPASEQCIGLMQCSCVLTHSTSPPPISHLLPPLTVTIFSSLSLSLFLSLLLTCSVPRLLSLLSPCRSLHLCRSPLVVCLHATSPPTYR